MGSGGWRNRKAYDQMTWVHGELVALEYNKIIEAIYIGWSIANSLTQHVSNCIFFLTKSSSFCCCIKISTRIQNRLLREQGCLAPGGASGFKDLAPTIETYGVVAEYIWYLHMNLHPLQRRCCLFCLSAYVPRERSSSFRIGGQICIFLWFIVIRLARERAVHWGFGPLKFILLISKVFKTWWVISDVCSL